MSTALPREALDEALAGAFEPIDRRAAEAAGVSPVDLLLYLFFTSYLPEDILTKTDRASMFNGLEVRTPFLDRAVAEYAGTVDPAVQKAAITNFQKRWYETEPLTILFYPEDVIAVNPKLKGFDATTFRPVFYPRPENWAITGGGPDSSAAFA